MFSQLTDFLHELMVVNVVYVSVSSYALHFNSDDVMYVRF